MRVKLAIELPCLGELRQRQGDSLDPRSFAQVLELESSSVQVGNVLPDNFVSQSVRLDQSVEVRGLPLQVVRVHEAPAVRLLEQGAVASPGVHCMHCLDLAEEVGCRARERAAGRIHLQ